MKTKPVAKWYQYMSRGKLLNYITRNFGNDPEIADMVEIIKSTPSNDRIKAKLEKIVPASETQRLVKNAAFRLGVQLYMFEDMHAWARYINPENQNVTPDYILRENRHVMTFVPNNINMRLGTYLEPSSLAFIKRLFTDILDYMTPRQIRLEDFTVYDHKYVMLDGYAFDIEYIRYAFSMKSEDFKDGLSLVGGLLLDTGFVGAPLYLSHGGCKCLIQQVRL